MITALGTALCLICAVPAGYLACSAHRTERLLWGSVLCSLALSLAVQFAYGGYYGTLLLGACLTSDLAIYLYFRTQSLLPAGPRRPSRTDQAYRIFFLWLALTLVGTGAYFLYAEYGLPSPGEAPGMGTLHERVWGPDGVLLAVPVLSLVALVVGGFFLVRRQR